MLNIQELIDQFDPPIGQLNERGVRSEGELPLSPEPPTVRTGTVLLGAWPWLCLLLLLIPFASFAAERNTAKNEFPVPKPPFTEGIFPCSSCHEGLEVNTKRRELTEAHQDIRLHHAENVRWCLDCHNPADRDRLRLANGDPVEFTESYVLCGQCHGPTYRDWKAGIHGKRTGYFSGGKAMYYLCVNCHNPHDPKFKSIKPEPAPFRPKSRQNVIR